MKDEQTDALESLRDEISRVDQYLADGRAPSKIVNLLHAEGRSMIELIAIFREVTGASIGDLKAFGQWWGPGGVTDPERFDEWAARVLRPAGH